MKAAIEFNATTRQTLGKGGSRALRRDKQVPVVVYANGKSNLSLAVDANSVTNEYMKGGFMSKLVALKLDGKNVYAIPREVQLNPVSDKIEHVDFLHVDEKSVVKVMVPVHFLNAEKSIGIKRGGVLNIVSHQVELYCPVTAIPKALEIDIAELNIGASIHIHNVAMPAGVSPVAKGRDFTIASIAGRQKDDDDAAGAGVSAGAVPAAKVAEQAKGGAAKAPAGGKAAPAKPAAKK